MLASSWQHDLNQLNINLHLPHAWDLIFVRGPDKASGSWLERWNLLDVFLVLLLTVGMGKLLGALWGLIMFTYLVVSFHSVDAPTMIWFNFLVTLSLLKALPVGWWSRLFRVWTMIALGGFMFMALR